MNRCTEKDGLHIYKGKAVYAVPGYPAECMECGEPIPFEPGTQEKAQAMSDRYITTWRKTPPNVLDWGFHISESMDEARITVANLQRQGAHQFSTHVLGDKLAELSSSY